MPIGEEPQETEAINASIRAAGRDPYRTIHPAPMEFTPELLETDPILRYFHYAHLPEPLRPVSEKFCILAAFLVTTLPRNAERSVALRKLLEAKDAGVRANVHTLGAPHVPRVWTGILPSDASQLQRPATAADTQGLPTAKFPGEASTNTFVNPDEGTEVRVTGGGSSETPIPFD